ncbi:MAG: hypothetical protein GX986_12730 [Firmicutes bacterium]|nr:hypothetical protein [Bacillota bacterium]
MKKLLSVALIVVLVLGAGVAAMAASLDSRTLPVSLRILPFARVDVPENLDFGEINFADGFARRTAKTNILLYTNDNVHLRIDSAGWDQPKFNGWQNWVSYQYALQSGNILSWHAGSGHGGWGDYGFNFTGAPIVIPFEARFQATAEDWWEAQAGSYSDTLTITVTAR